MRHFLSNLSGLYFSTWCLLFYITFFFQPCTHFSTLLCVLPSSIQHSTDSTNLPHCAPHSTVTPPHSTLNTAHCIHSSSYSFYAIHTPVKSIYYTHLYTQTLQKIHSELLTPRPPHTLPTLQNSHSTNLHNTLHCPHTALHTVHSPHPLHFLHTPCTLCAPHTLSTLYAVLHTLHILHNLHTLHYAHSAPLHTHAHFTLYTSALEFVYKCGPPANSTFHTLRAPHSTHHLPHSTLRTANSTLHISHSTAHTHIHTPPSALDPLHITWLPTLRTTKLHTPYSTHLALHTALPTLHILHFALHAPFT